MQEVVHAVYSSGAAVINLHLTNTGPVEYRLSLYPLLHLPDDSLRAGRFDSSAHGLLFSHHESLVAPA